jgi:hypothetical protein
MSQCVSRNFPGIFGIFRIFFVALLIYLDISGFIFAQENISKKAKNISFLLGRARRPDPHQRRPSNGPTQLRPASLSRGRRQVGATCHPPPPVAPSPTRSRVRAASRPCALLDMGPHAEAASGPYKTGAPPLFKSFPQNPSPKPGAATVNPRTRRRCRSPRWPSFRRREAPLELRKKVRRTMVPLEPVLSP